MESNGPSNWVIFKRNDDLGLAGFNMSDGLCSGIHGSFGNLTSTDNGDCDISDETFAAAGSYCNGIDGNGTPPPPTIPTLSQWGLTSWECSWSYLEWWLSGRRFYP